MNSKRRIHRLVATAIAAAALLAIVPMADAKPMNQTTRWFTIDAQPGNASAPARFWAYGNDGVQLKAYRSGDPEQQWMMVQPDYPNAPRTNGQGGHTCDFSGCSFSGHGQKPEFKLVNRASGRCAQFVDKRLVMRPCEDQDAATLRQQTWSRSFSNGEDRGVPTDYVQLYAPTAKGMGCVTRIESEKNKGNFMFAGVCADASPPPSYQAFRFLGSAEIHCKVRFQWEACFYEGQTPRS